jgi:hypothetical protein
MNIKHRLMEKRSSILMMCCDAALMIPEGAGPGFLEKQKAFLADTPGRDLSKGMGGLFDALLQGVIPDDVSRFLDNMIRIRAASDFTASQAVAFILAVKRAARKELGNETLADPEVREELAAWEAAVDDMVLFAFDIYVRHREVVFDFKADEAKEKTLRLLKKAKLIPDDQDNL